MSSLYIGICYYLYNLQVVLKYIGWSLLERLVFSLNGSLLAPYSICVLYLYFNYV